MRTAAGITEGEEGAPRVFTSLLDALDYVRSCRTEGEVHLAFFDADGNEVDVRMDGQDA